MAVFELPLAMLREYQGRNPCPPDMDDFWDRSLAEMRERDSDIELKPAGFVAGLAECFDLFFTGVGGARIHAKYLRPTGHEAPHPALLMFHGYTLDSGDWADKLHYAARGFSVLAMDCRGQAGLSEDVGGVLGSTLTGHITRGLLGPPESLLFRQVFLDCAQLAGIAMELPEVDPTRVGVMGASQGGALTLACAALEPRIKLAAPTYPFLCDYQRVWEMDFAVQAYEDLRTYFRQHDPLHNEENAIFTRLGYIDLQHLAGRIRARVLMAVGLMDTLCPPSTQFAAYNRITAPKEVVVYPDYGHETLPGWQDRVWEFMADL